MLFTIVIIKKKYDLRSTIYFTSSELPALKILQFCSNEYSSRRRYNVATNMNEFVIVLHLNQLNNVFTNGKRIAPHCLDRIVVTHLAGLVIIVFQLQYYYNIVLICTHYAIYTYISTRKPTDRKSGYIAWY